MVAHVWWVSVFKLWASNPSYERFLSSSSWSSFSITCNAGLLLEDSSWAKDDEDDPVEEGSPLVGVTEALDEKRNEATVEMELLLVMELELPMTFSLWLLLLLLLLFSVVVWIAMLLLLLLLAVLWLSLLL